MIDLVLEAKNKISSMIEKKEHLPLIRNYFIELREQGFSSETVSGILEELRTHYKTDDVREDLILELLDISTNYCSAHLRVWN